ncbi:unnamed protein product [Rotaria magnacalcarata]|uniref:Transmembrane protein n=2 Tax=Rotaria magnacalcarata TaxID=392030 RepID=A0A816DUN0_9BILA|nr:unnamed protein product [Rotaria magnacalcarata]
MTTTTEETVAKIKNKTPVETVIVNDGLTSELFDVTNPFSNDQIFKEKSTKVPIAYIIVGVLWFDKCTIQPRIPTYLIMTGVAGIIGIVLVILINPAPSSTNKKTADAKRAVKSDSINVRLCGTAGCVLVGISLIFVIGWFVAGCIWVFGAFCEVQ